MARTSKAERARKERVAEVRARLDAVERLRELRRREQIAVTFDVGADDPVDWARRRCQVAAWSKQRDVLRSVASHPRTAVPSCHSSGKTFIAAVAVGWWLTRWPPGEAFALTSAPTSDQVRAQLWQEIHRVHAAGRLPGRLNLTEWWHGATLIGLGRKSRDQSPDALTGHHARHLLVVVDESSGFAEALWEAVDTLTASGDSRVLAIGNPDHVGSPFHRRCVSPDWHTIRISAWDTPQFTGEDTPIAPLLLSREWVERKAREWGKESPLWTAKVEAEFPEQAGDTVIGWGQVRAAQARWDTASGGRRVLSVDVARLGSDQTVFGLLDGERFQVVKTMAVSRTPQVTAWAARLARQHGAVEVRVDADGIGGAVVDELEVIRREDPARLGGAQIVGMNAGGRPVNPDDYVIARDEWWWEAKKALDTWLAVDPADDDLAAQLTAPRGDVGTGRHAGKLRAESKESMARRGIPSPDRADCAIMAVAPLRPPPPEAVGFGAGSGGRLGDLPAPVNPADVPL